MARTGRGKATGTRVTRPQRLGASLVHRTEVGHRLTSVGSQGCATRLGLSGQRAPTAEGYSRRVAKGLVETVRDANRVVALALNDAELCIAYKAKLPWSTDELAVATFGDGESGPKKSQRGRLLEQQCLRSKEGSPCHRTARKLLVVACFICSLPTVVRCPPDRTSATAS